MAHRRLSLTFFMQGTQNPRMLTPPYSSAIAVVPASSPMRSMRVRRVLVVVLVLNAMSAALKISVGARTGAVTVLGAALESVLDMLSNCVAILAVSVASRAPDDDHPYGHEKFETLAPLGIGCFFSITFFELLRQSIGELLGGQMVTRATMADAVLLVSSLVVNLLVVA